LTYNLESKVKSLFRILLLNYRIVFIESVKFNGYWCIVMKLYCYVILGVLLLQGCAAVNTFPTIARAGDTVSLLVGGSEDARKETISITLTDVNSNVWDLQALGKVRSVFSVRPDGRAEGLHYSSYLELVLPWGFGHEPVQTVLVIDVPDGVASGMATLNVSTNTTDNSSGFGEPFAINLEIIPGAGSTDDFLFKHVITGDTPTDFSRLEPLPHAKISFVSGTAVAAVSLEVDFDESILPADDLNLYVPQSTVRDLASNTFDKTQRMVYWRQDGQQLFVDIISPQGIDSGFLNVYVLHPRGLTGAPGFSLLNAQVYDVNGSLLSITPVLEYFP